MVTIDILMKDVQVNLGDILKNIAGKRSDGHRMTYYIYI